MGLFTADLYRYVALGFVGGALALVAVMGSAHSGFTDSMVSPAIAATAPHE